MRWTVSAHLVRPGLCWKAGLIRMSRTRRLAFSGATKASKSLSRVFSNFFWWGH